MVQNLDRFEPISSKSPFDDFREKSDSGEKRLLDFVISDSEFQIEFHGSVKRIDEQNSDNYPFVQTTDNILPPYINFKTAAIAAQKMEVDVLTVVASVLPFVLRDDPIRQHDSVLTGRLYYREIMKSPSSNRFSNVVRMDKETFILLKNFLAQHGNLRRSESINIGQKVMIFIHV